MSAKFNLGNLSGTIMLNDTPLIKFESVRGKIVSYELLSQNAKIMPFEFMDLKVTEERILNFFEARIVPPTRIGINERLAESPIKYYDPERIIRYQKGRCIDDLYWVDCKPLDD